MMVQKNTSKRVVFDVEADGFLGNATKILCIVTCQPDGTDIRHYYDTEGIYSQYYKGSVSEGLKYLNEQDEIIGHNIANYDQPLTELLNCTTLTAPMYDTFLSSCLIFPNQQKHSIEEYVKLLDLNQLKIQIDDWSELTLTILNRCHNDVLINAEVYQYLSDHEWDHEVFMGNLSLEQSVSKIQAYQELHGVHFDREKAWDLLELCDSLLESLESEIVTQAKPKVRQVGVTVEKPFKKSDQTLKAVPARWFDGTDLAGTVGGPFSKLEFIPLNLRSPQQVTEFLLAQGWKPKEWNFKFNEQTGRKEKTSPKLTEASWGSLPEGLGQKIGRYKTINHRRNSLWSRKPSAKTKKYTGALMSERIRDGRIPAKALTCATPTSRYRHMETICNLPSANVSKSGDLIWYPDDQKVLFGTEVRSLYGVHPDHWQVGVDLAGIEARMMCHYAYVYPGGPELAELVLEGDFHQHNADTWDVDRSPYAKSGLYALMYGCGEAKLASTLGKPKGSGKKWMDAFWDNNPALKSLIANLELAYSNKGYLVGLDGRRLDVRDKRKLLNTLLQGSAAVVFKLWMLKCDAYLKTLPFEAQMIIQYHDENQTWVHSGDKELAIMVGEELCKLAKETGRELNLRVPIEAEAKVGKTWAECH